MGRGGSLGGTGELCFLTAQEILTAESWIFFTFYMHIYIHFTCSSSAAFGVFRKCIIKVVNENLN